MIQIVLAAILILAQLVLFSGLSELHEQAAQRASFMLILGIIFALADIILCVFLLRGSNIARIIITVLFVLSPILSFFQDGFGVKTVVQALLSVVFIIILWNHLATLFFTAKPARSPSQK